jgi:hypothetical protein
MFSSAVTQHNLCQKNKAYKSTGWNELTVLFGKNWPLVFKTGNQMSAYRLSVL